MEKNRIHDQDEILIIRALHSVHTQDFDILKGIEDRMKPRKTKKISLLVALVAIFLLGTTAFAAQHFGSFDRLRGIVGNEHAGTLTPIEIASTDLGQDVVYDGIRVELVAASISGNVVNVYFTLEDTTANRLNGDFELMNGVFPADRDFPLEALFGSFATTEIIDRDENGILTVHSRHEFGQCVEGFELNFVLSAIYLDTQDEQHAPVAVNLADFFNNNAYMLYQYPNPNPWGSSIQVTTSAVGERFDWEYHELVRNRYVDKIRYEGIQVLAPNNADINLSPYFARANARASISSIGIVDGRLHVQVAHPQGRAMSEVGWDGFTRVALFRGSLAELESLRAERQRLFDLGYMPWEIETPELWNNSVSPYLAIMFYMDDMGNLFHPNTSGIDADGNWYEIYDPRLATAHMINEHIFDIDLENIHEYVLIAHTFSQQTLPVGWVVAFNQ